MAIQVNYGEYPEAYVRIEWYSGDKREVNATARIYIDVLSADGSAAEDFGFSFIYDLTSPENILSQGYAVLKSLSIFERAIDV